MERLCHLPSALAQEIVQLGDSTGASRVVLFGSRARGDCRPRSDIDLAVYGLSESQAIAFRSALEDLPTLLKIDCVMITPFTCPQLQANIEREGILLYERNKAE